MINVLLTDALIEDVNHYVKRHVLPIEMGNVTYRPISRWDRDDDGRRVADERDERNGDAQRRYNRVPDRHRNALSDGYRSRGTAHPIDGFGSVPVISNVGIPLFDGRGSIWLLVDGIVVVFEDAMIYCIVSSSELQQWLMSEIYSSLVNEYNTLVVEYEKVQRAASALPDAAFAIIAPVAVADITPETAVVTTVKVGDAAEEVNIDEVVELMVIGDEINPYDYSTMEKFFTPNKYCKTLRMPINAHDIHHASRSKVMRIIVSESSPVVKTEPLFPDSDGSDMLAGNTATIPTGHHAIYSRLQAEDAAFIHLFHCGGLQVSFGGSNLVVLDVFLVNMFRFNGVVLRTASQPTYWTLLNMPVESMRSLLNYTHQFRETDLELESREWVNTYLFK